MIHNEKCTCQSGWICPQCFESQANGYIKEIAKLRDELEKCYAGIADKEAIIADFMKAVLKNGCSDTDKIVHEYEQKLK